MEYTLLIGAVFLATTNNVLLHIKNQKDTPFTISKIRMSQYIDFKLKRGNFSAEILF